MTKPLKQVGDELVEFTDEEYDQYLADQAEAVEASKVQSVSARQFKLQLFKSNLLTQVNAWVNSQSMEVQIAYEYSGSFVRAEPMMQAGFIALGFTEEQRDAFFEAAAQL